MTTRILACATLVFSVFLCKALKSQDEPCGFNTYHKDREKTLQAANHKIAQALEDQRKNGHSTYTIPVVVHVIHNGGSENIKDFQILNQIRILNEDFGRMVGTPGEGGGVDTQLRFKLAQIDPEGRCTDGIVRVKSSLTNHQTYQRGQLSLLSSWPSERYLNIYVVQNINNGGGIAGYATFPGGPPSDDGIVVRHDYFGNGGTAGSRLGRTTTHEIGHWLGLYHTFQDGCGSDSCNTGDLVCDTPPVANPNYSCSVKNSCSNDLPDLPDQIENYMDYTPDACKNMFSAGQSARMKASLEAIRTQIWTDSNLVATGTDSLYVPSTQCGVVANFSAINTQVCPGGKVALTSTSLNKPISFTWYCPGGTPYNSNSESPTITYNEVGEYNVSLVVADSLGNIDTLMIPNFVKVSEPETGLLPPYFEGLENPDFSISGISIENPDLGITWERDTVAVPDSGFASIKINNLINTNYGQIDAFHLPAFNLQQSNGTAMLNFSWAYAPSDANYSDELLVQISKDCGASWTTAFYRTGTSLRTAPPQTTPYIPDSSTVWKKASISLNAYTSQQRVMIKFVNITDGGNCLYIDNIKLSTGTTGIDPLEPISTFQVYPNPLSGQKVLNVQTELKGNFAMEIFDASGRLVLKSTKLSQSWSISLPDLEFGVYTFRISGSDAFYTGKLVID